MTTPWSLAPLLLAASALLAPLHALPSGQDGPVDKALLGAWASDDDPRRPWLFEDTRAARPGIEGPVFFRTTWTDDGVTLETSGHEISLSLEPEGDVLWITEAGERRAFQRLEDVPAELTIQPLPLGEPGELQEELVRAVRAELAARTAEDQRVRRQLDQVPPAEHPPILEEMRRIDEANTAWLIDLVSVVGWIDAERFGAPAADDAFLLVQHSGDLSLMTTALPLIESDVREGVLQGQLYALLYDRLSLQLGGLQRYGTQLAGNDEKGLFVSPMEDPDAVDARRAEMGMGPLLAYLELFREEGQELPRHYTDGRSFEP